MQLWRLSGHQHAAALDGGYGLLFEGRWNTIGRPVTYSATSPSLCVLEKLVHVEDPDLLPRLVMVRYRLPDGAPVESATLQDLPADWRRQEALTQQRGDRWLDGRQALVLRVPSAIVPLEDSPDQNVLINHRHPMARDIVIERLEPFELDVRLFGE